MAFRAGELGLALSATDVLRLQTVRALAASLGHSVVQDEPEARPLLQLDGGDLAAIGRALGLG